MPRRLTGGVWLLDLGLVEPVDAYAYLVDDTGAAGDGTVTLVDTGLFLNRPTLDDELAAAGEGYTLADIDRVLVTHYDLDHVGGLRASGRRTPPCWPVRTTRHCCITRGCFTGWPAGCGRFPTSG